jgi:hypothetical protein
MTWCPKPSLGLLAATVLGCFVSEVQAACPPGQHEMIVAGEVRCVPLGPISPTFPHYAPGGARHEADRAAERVGAPLTPVREYLRAGDIPPPEAGAYGIVVLQSKATSANKAKLMMVCSSYVSSFPRGETSRVPVSDRMITIWPLDDPDAAEAKEDDCDFILSHYDLNASEAAIIDAQKQNATFDGEGPYLVGWSPSNSRGVPDKLVLVIDMSSDNTQEMIDYRFRFWKNQIVQDPSLWRNGWSLENFRVALKAFVDKYGGDMLTAVKLVGARD